MRNVSFALMAAGLVQGHINGPAFRSHSHIPEPEKAEKKSGPGTISEDDTFGQAVNIVACNFLLA